MKLKPFRTQTSTEKSNCFCKMERKILAIEESKDQNIRIVLVGKIGAGKSSTGNTILQKKAFASKSINSSVTKECQKETGEFERQPLAVVDTPGLFDTSKSEKEVLAEVAKCISLSAPGPHVFLVVIQPQRFTKEEQITIKLIKKIFGEKASDYVITLFTHGDDLEEDGISVKELVEANKEVSSFISQCGGGYHLFNNRSKDPSQVRELLQKINAMVKKNGGRYYTNETYQEANNAIKQQTRFLLRQNPHLEILQAITMAELNNPFIRSVMTYTVAGALVGGACGAVLGPVGIAAGAVLGATVGASVGATVGAWRSIGDLMGTHRGTSVVAGSLASTVSVSMRENPSTCILQ